MFNPMDPKCSLVYPNYIEFSANETSHNTDGSFRVIFESSLPDDDRKYILQFSLYNTDDQTEQLYNVIIPEESSLCTEDCIITTIITDKIYTTIKFTNLKECDKYILTSCLDYIE
jgi:hypothetical protein